ncbi:hypothetical protein [Sporomusa sp. KB1]|jgi:hypothetical protein|uniref:hypothetical protein n=1 Tax=Sporomusa sp. KB1 TaxID=943346 RepID=UPI0011A2A23B|nr:hypothetical protein [Sporomusa sp. KB1]
MRYKEDRNYLGGQVLGQNDKNGLADNLQTRVFPGADNQIRTDDLRFTKVTLAIFLHGEPSLQNFFVFSIEQTFVIVKKKRTVPQQ